jgi:hypothetical protein
MNGYVINGPSGKEVLSAGLTTAGAAAAGPIGAALGNLVANLFGGGKGKPGDPRSQDYIKLVEAIGGGAFDAWVKAVQPGAQGWTTAQLLPLLYAWLFDSGKSVLWWTNDLNPKGAAYKEGLTEDAYKAMGIDYWASVANRQRGIQTLTPGGRWAGWVMLPGAGTIDAPTAATNQLKSALASTAGQISQAATDALTQKITELTQGAGIPPPPAPKNDQTLLLVGAGLLALFALK